MFYIAVQSSKTFAKEERDDESSASDMSVYVAIIHDDGTWKIAPLPANYRLRYICEKGM